ncbi:hypothetical protein AGR9A_Cc80068 [Agrobacterium salinitolerans str. Hayward 0363]|nr:hypothetical protein AGR9A_Cc80068 [Agrobacterium salinitolerans str. Hayward 0363]
MHGVSSGALLSAGYRYGRWMMASWSVSSAFQHMGIGTLHANPLFDNRASHRLMDKLGFVATGRANAFCRQRGKIVPLRPYRLDKE